MALKRIIGVVTVKGGMAVQSIGFNKYLPLGDPVILVENLDKWGADEILLQCIDRTILGVGPDYDLISKIARSGIATPLIYGGGISSVDCAAKAFACGADRLVVESMIRDAPKRLIDIASRFGSQSLIASFPVTLVNGIFSYFDYLSRSPFELSQEILEILKNRIVSEVLLIDSMNEGRINGFDLGILNKVRELQLPPILAFGGVTEPDCMISLLKHPDIAGIAIGNSLNYRESSISHIREALNQMPIRSRYESN